MFLILYNAYSRWIEVYPMLLNITSNATINSLRHSFATHELPHIIITDNGTSFTICTINRIKHITTATYHPSSNGSARVVQTFKSSNKNICENSNSDLITSIIFYCPTEVTCIVLHCYLLLNYYSTEK